MDDLTGWLWERFGSLTVEAVPGPVRTVALQCVLDWYGCALAGSREPGPCILVDELGGVAGPASLIGSDRRVGALQAALINGTAGHALDFDDTNTVMGGHPTAPVLPAVLALAEERGASGAELLSALVVGVEVESRLALAIGASHYAKGWHVTSSIGVLGAAAAASRLLALDADGARRAIGLAASQSSGLKANFGTMTKPFHAGHAAERGLLAARLASRGFTAAVDAVGAPQGLAQAAGDGELHVEQLARYDDEWITLQTLFKYHAACYLTHAAIEAVAGMRDAIGAQPVKGATVTVHPSLLDVCAIPRPVTGLEAKFSLAATVAFALLGADTTDVGTYADAQVRDTDVQRLIGLIEVKTDPRLEPTASRVEVTTAGGVHGATADTGVPATDLAAQGERLRDKFLRLASTVLGSEPANRLMDELGALADLPDVRTLHGAAATGP